MHGWRELFFIGLSYYKKSRSSFPPWRGGDSRREGRDSELTRGSGDRNERWKVGHVVTQGTYNNKGRRPTSVRFQHNSHSWRHQRDLTSGSPISSSDVELLNRDASLYRWQSAIDSIEWTLEFDKKKIRFIIMYLIRRWKIIS